MKKYKVVSPVGYHKGDEGATCVVPGTVVEMDAEQGNALVAEGRLEVVKGSEETLEKAVEQGHVPDAVASPGSAK